MRDSKGKAFAIRIGALCSLILVCLVAFWALHRADSARKYTSYAWRETPIAVKDRIMGIAVSKKGTAYVIGFRGEVLRSDDGGVHWRKADARTLSMCMLDIMVDSRDRVYLGTGSGVFRSDDDGRTWTRVNKGLTCTGIFAVSAGPDGALYAGTEFGSLFVSHDQGDHWECLISDKEIDGSILAVLPSSRGRLILGTRDYGIAIVSPKGGKLRSVWEPEWPWYDTDHWASFRDLTDMGNGRMVAVESGYVLLSEDAGEHWRVLRHAKQRWYYNALAVASDGEILVGSQRGLYGSKDLGKRWRKLPCSRKHLWPPSALRQPGIRALAVDAKGRIYAGTDRGTVIVGTPR